MNRLKKEELRKRRKARAGLNTGEIVALDREDVIRASLERKARDLHFKRFPEEYDWTQDSIGDANLRARGENPMNEGYTRRVNERREAAGIPPLTDSGMPPGNQSLNRCRNLVFRKALIEREYRLPPADRCLLCEKRLHQTGGVRLIATNDSHLVRLTDRQLGGGDQEHPCRSSWLFPGENLWVTVREPRSVWTDAVMERAKQAFLSLRHPWFCQPCGGRSCSNCGSALIAPPAADVITPDGRVSHSAALPINPGCINPDCLEYRAPNAES